MSDPYETALENLLEKLENWIERENDEIDITRAEGLMTLECPNGVQLVFSRQRPLQELWLATPQGPYHFAWKNNWQTAKGEALLPVLVNALDTCGHIRVSMENF